MSAKLTFTGEAEFFYALNRLPLELHEDARDIINSHAYAAAAKLTATYLAVAKTGNLARGVGIEFDEPSEFYHKATVLSVAKHAFIYEDGTDDRSYTTKRGNIHRTGASPPHPHFVDIMVRQREAMYDAIADMMRTHGLTVTR
jgi:hypothetical protein